MGYNNDIAKICSFARQTILDNNSNSDRDRLSCCMKKSMIKGVQHQSLDILTVYFLFSTDLKSQSDHKDISKYENNSYYTKNRMLSLRYRLVGNKNAFRLNRNHK